MFFKARPVLSAMALVLVQATAMSQTVHPILPADQIAAARALQPQRAAQALAFLKAQNLGLGPQDSFRELTVFTNSQGQTIARYEQVHQGYSVFGTAFSVRIDPDGSAHLLAQDRALGISPALAATLSSEDAVLAAHRNLVPAGAYASAPTAELVVFPSVLSQGFKLLTDDKGTPFLDRDGSLVGPRPSTDYTLAYRVKANFNNAQDGYREYNLIVDAGTGQVLRKWDDAAGFIEQAPRVVEPITYANREKLAASLPIVAARQTISSKMTAAKSVVGAPAASLSPLAAKGWGRDMYLGLVPLDTAQSPLGTGYDLIDLTRGISQPHALFGTTGSQTWYSDDLPAMNSSVMAPQTDYEFPYLGAYYGTYTMDNGGWSADGKTPAGSATNVWGDGLGYDSPYAFVNNRVTRNPLAISEYHYGDLNGQTAAVGAHNATQVTYDMYGNVLGWKGVDGKDSGMISVVHDNLGGLANAHWSNVDLMMHYGDGTWSVNNPNGYRSFATISIGGHEVSHGVMHNLANVNYWGEGMGLNEANSDILGVSVEAYSRRGPSDAIDKLPEGRITWTMAPELSADGKPLRWLYKPSKDGLSPDAWFAGINNLDGHYSMGPVIRFFYFLAMGGSADATSDTYSPYLPQGMTGIGIDQASHIWFKAMSEHMTKTTAIRSMRTPLLDAVTDLYGLDSVQGQAVANALAAVNIGAAYGTQGRPLVTLPNNLVDPNSPLGAIGLPTGPYRAAGLQYLYYTVPMVPVGETAKLHVNVTNTANTDVSWTTGWPLLMVAFPSDGANGTGAAGPAAANGSFEADGTYHAPLVGPKFCMTRAASKADPLEFAYLPLMTVQLDADGDAENDAVDMGAFALGFNLPRIVTEVVNNGGTPTGVIYWYPGDTYIGFSFDDYTLQAWNEAFMNAFGQ